MRTPRRSISWHDCKQVAKDHWKRSAEMDRPGAVLQGALAVREYASQRGGPFPLAGRIPALQRIISANCKLDGLMPPTLGRRIILFVDVVKENVDQGCQKLATLLPAMVARIVRKDVCDVDFR